MSLVILGVICALPSSWVARSGATARHACIGDARNRCNIRIEVAFGSLLRPQWCHKLTVMRACQLNPRSVLVCRHCVGAACWCYAWMLMQRPLQALLCPAHATQHHGLPLSTTRLVAMNQHTTFSAYAPCSASAVDDQISKGWIGL